MRYIVYDILIVLFILAVTFFFGFHTGKLYQKQHFTKELWKECVSLKNSHTSAVRIGDIWLSYQGAIPKNECGKLFMQDFCVIEEFK
jgi:hypothetical protein